MKSARFPTGVFKIDFAWRIDGVSDAPADEKDDEKSSLEMTILEGDDFRAFHSALHEGLHAHGVPSKYIHDKVGCTSTDDLAKFLWRRVKMMRLKSKK
jgi:hypothetical protein